MDGGINAIRGYLFQYLICILDSFQEPWTSVIIEPSMAEDKVDILWLFKADSRVYKKAVQIKSTQNQFGKPETLKTAYDLRNYYNDADSYEVVLIGHASSTLLKYLKESEEQEVRILYPKVFDLDAFKGNACHKVDKYLEENYAAQLPWYQLENIVFSLLGELQYYSTHKKEVTKEKFENKLMGWVESHVHHVDYELQTSQNFRRLYGFDEPPSLRIAIDKFYNQSRKIKRSFFKECRNFLDVEPHSKTLKIIYPPVDKMFFYFGLILQLIGSIPTIAFLILVFYLHWIFIFHFILCFSILLQLTFFVRPYRLAKKIDNELKKLSSVKQVRKSSI